MRQWDAEADDYFRRGREGAMPVGSALFDETIRGAVRLEWVSALRTASSLDDARSAAETAVRLWVAKHNARSRDRNWQRWIEFGQDDLRRLVAITSDLILRSHST
jgi:hypothetical protein